MHMADALLSPAVGITMDVISVGAMAYSGWRLKRTELTEKKIPLMAISGAFVFAAQMINFTIPGTGSSGHIGGGILLAALLGGGPAFLTIAAVLVIQCLFFADGGLLALGSNIFNMGVIPCLLVYPLIFRPFIRNKLNKKNISLASIVAVVVALQLGAFSVVLETLLSGLTELPFSAFVLAMQPIHLAIGAVEGIVTAAMLCFIYSMRPEILYQGAQAAEQSMNKVTADRQLSMKKVIVVLACLTLIVGGVVSLVASSYPDGLEWSVERVNGSPELEAEGETYENSAAIQDVTAFMPDYDYKESGENSILPGTSVAGIVGSVATFALAGIVGLCIAKVKGRKNVIGEKVSH